MTQAELMKAIDGLKRRGVSKYRDIAGGGFEVEFFRLEPEAKAEATEPDPEECKCTHKPHEHQGGVCLMGCPAEHCGAKGE